MSMQGLFMSCPAPVHCNWTCFPRSCFLSNKISCKGGV